MYSFCNGDPLNKFDPTGRLGKNGGMMNGSDSWMAQGNQMLDDFAYNQSSSGQFMQGYQEQQANDFWMQNSGYFEGPEDEKSHFSLEQTVSSVLNGAPLVGMAKLWWEGLSDHDLITGQRLDRSSWETALGFGANALMTFGSMSGMVTEAAQGARFGDGFANWQAANVKWLSAAPGNTEYGAIEASFGSTYARVSQNIAANQAATATISRGLITMDLRALTTIAAQEVDAQGVNAFTPAQQNAVANYPNLAAAYRGSTIDSSVRIAAGQDPLLNWLQGRPNKGPDFIDPVTGRWWDMTTPAGWPKHVAKYGPNGTLLPTR